MQIPEKLNRFNKRRYLSTALAIISFGGSYAGYSTINDKHGRHVNFPAKTANKNVSDGSVKILFENIHDNPKFSKVVKLIKPTIFLAVEVDGNSAVNLHHRLPKYTADWDQADNVDHIFKGGYGNDIFTKIKPHNYKHRSISGNTGLLSSMYNIIFKGVNVSDSRQENRDIQYEQIEISRHGKATMLQLLNTHISGNKDVHSGQLENVMKDIKDMTINQYPAALCGDFNDDRTTVMQDKFAKIGYSLMIKLGDPEHAIGNGDYCAVHAGDSSVSYSLNVLSHVYAKRLSDHSPLLVNLQIN